MSNLSPSNRISGYARAHQGSDAVARYFRKLGNRIDVLRDDQEKSILSTWLVGRLFDCTIGVGRFVGRLPGVTEYCGMDLSPQFIEFIGERYPDVKADVADLMRGIPHADHSFDCVICLRSLSAIGDVERILREMVRVVRLGGIVVVDYGRSARPGFRVSGEKVPLDSEDFEAALRAVDAEIVRRYRVDGVLTRLKTRLRIFRFLTGPRGRIVPDWLLMLTERCLAPLLWQRQIVVLSKRNRKR